VPNGHANVKQISQSLVAAHRNRNLIGNQSGTRPQVLPIDSLSVGLKKDFRNRGEHSLQPVMQSISHNPLNDEEEPISKTAKKQALHSGHLLDNNGQLREGSNSQRSFRIRKGYIRSISRGSNISKASNLTHDHAKLAAARTIDNNQKTIEHPTDTEDADNGFESNDDFEHINNSPDIKLKSIEIDEEFSQRKNDGPVETGESGNSHNKNFKSSREPSQKSTLINQYSYGSESMEYQQMKRERDQALLLVQKMKDCFEKFKQAQNAPNKTNSIV
jgi:hypothetical protein